MPHAVKIVKVGKSDKQREEMRNKKIQKRVEVVVEKNSGKKESISIEKINHDVNVEYKIEKHR